MAQSLSSGQVVTANPPTGRCPEQASGSQSVASLEIAHVACPKKVRNGGSLHALNGVWP